MCKEHRVCSTLSLTIFRILAWPFRVTWCHPLRDHYFDSSGSISCRCSIVAESVSPDVFEIGQNILESWPWPFKVTWRHRSRDHSLCHMPLPISLTVFEIFGPKTQTDICRHTSQVIFIFCPMQCIALDRHSINWVLGCRGPCFFSGSADVLCPWMAFKGKRTIHSRPCWNIFISWPRDTVRCRPWA